MNIFRQKKIPVLLCLLLGASNLFAYKEVNYHDTEAQYVTAEEPTPKALYDKDSKTWYSVSNDDKFIYVRLKVIDADQQQKIVNNGLELWVDVKGKRNRNTGITFPVIERKHFTPSKDGRPPEPIELMQERDTSDKESAIKALKKSIGAQTEMSLTGFAGDLNGKQNIKHASGLSVAIYFEKDTLIYDAQIPFAVLSKPLPVGSTASIIVIEKGVQLPDFGEGGDGGGDGPHGDGGPGGPGGPPPGGMPDIFRSDIFWYKFTIGK